MNIVAQFVAAMLDRAFGSKPSVMLTIVGVVSFIAGGLAAVQPTWLPPKYQPYLISVAAFFGLLGGALGHGSKGLPPQA